MVTPLGYGEEVTQGAAAAAALHEEPRALKTCADVIPVPLCGPVDCKGMEGCDGRHYVLDLVHMMPRDVNWTTEGSHTKNETTTTSTTSTTTATEKKTIGDSVMVLPTVASSTTTGPIPSPPATAAASASSLLRAPKGCRESLCLLRPELVRAYANWNVNKAKENVIQQHRQKLREEQLVLQKKEEEQGKDDTKKENDGTKETEGKKQKKAAADSALSRLLTQKMTQAMIPPLVNPNVFSKHTYTSVTPTTTTPTPPTTPPTTAPTTASTASTTSTTSIATTTTIEKDEAMTANVCQYLLDRVIPVFLREIKLSNVVLVDGSSLIATMHQRGINVRYLGHMSSIWIKDYNRGRTQRYEHLQQLQQLHEQQQKEGKKSSSSPPSTPPTIVLSKEDDVRRSYFLRLCEIEMIARTVRHTISTLLRENSNIMVAPAAILAQFFSKMMTRKGGLGYTKDKADKGGNKGGNKSGSTGPTQSKRNNSSPTAGAVDSTITPTFEFTLKAGLQLLPSTGKEMWTSIHQDVYAKFRYNLHIWPGNYETSSKKGILIDVDRIALLRRVCQLLGISITSRDYDFNLEHPIVSSDIQNMVPIVKDGFTKCQMKDIIELIEYGRSCLNKKQLNEAHVALQEALVYLYQAVGVMHEYVAVACSLLAQTYHAGQNIEQAILFEQRALCLYERMSTSSSAGYDSYQVIHSHNFLATLFTKIKNGQKMAAKHMVRYLYLQRISCGQYHSDMNNSLIKLGSIYQSVGRLDQACKTYQYALRKSIPHTINYGTNFLLLSEIVCASQTRE